MIDVEILKHAGEVRRFRAGGLQHNECQKRPEAGLSCFAICSTCPCCIVRTTLHSSQTPTGGWTLEQLRVLGMCRLHVCVVCADLDYIITQFVSDTTC
jgi:hypothetical protein